MIFNRGPLPELVRIKWRPGDYTVQFSGKPWIRRLLFMIRRGMTQYRPPDNPRREVQFDDGGGILFLGDNLRVEFELCGGEWVEVD